MLTSFFTSRSPKHQQHSRLLAINMLSIILMLFWAAGLVLAFPFAQTNQARQVDHSFSIEVTDRLQIKRNFMSDWAAARNKWGNKIPELSSAGFRLADSGVFLLAPEVPGNLY